ncbi:MAG TPA: DUF6382 domain-containing protein [Clostridia bacterium]|nr:DUF6382 domain-containing protein [Clostridia bacterium]
MDLSYNGPDEIGFRYESDASSSFLVASALAGASEYQCSMLGRNYVRCIIPPERIIKDGTACFYYNITSRVPLSIYLKRKKLNRQEFLKFVFDVASSVNDSYGYLLNASNFVFCQEYVYIDPDTLEPSLIYIPAQKGSEDCEGLKSFISEMLLQHIHAEGFESENIVHRILSAVKSEHFNIKGFTALISELLYGGNLGKGNKPDVDILSGGHSPAGFSGEAETFSSGYRGKTLGGCDDKTSGGYKGKRITEQQAGDNDAAARRSFPLFAMFAVMLQFVMAFMIYLCRGLIDMAGSNHTANYAAVFMIALAIDVLVLKKILTDRRVKMNAKPEDCQEDVRRRDTGKRNTARSEAAPAAVVRAAPAVVVRAAPDRSAASRQEPGRSAASGQEPGRPETLRQESAMSGFLMVEASRTEATLAAVVSQESGISEFPKPDVGKPDFVKAAASRSTNKTVLLGRHAKGVRMLKSTGKNTGEGDIILDKDDFVIGRLEGHADHVLFNNAIGKLHAQLIKRNGISYVKDLNSMNGTFINNNRLESNKEYELKENDRLLLANSEYIFTFGD